MSFATCKIQLIFHYYIYPYVCSMHLSYCWICVYMYAFIFGAIYYQCSSSVEPSVLLPKSCIVLKKKMNIGFHWIAAITSQWPNIIYFQILVLLMRDCTRFRSYFPMKQKHHFASVMLAIWSVCVCVDWNCACFLFAGIFFYLQSKHRLQ